MCVHNTCCSSNRRIYQINYWTGDIISDSCIGCWIEQRSYWLMSTDFNLPQHKATDDNVWPCVPRELTTGCSKRPWIIDENHIGLMTNQLEILTHRIGNKHSLLILNCSIMLAVVPIITDLHLNLNMVQNEVLYFLSSSQAPLTTGEELGLSAITRNVEGRREAGYAAEPPASWLISTQTTSPSPQPPWWTHSDLLSARSNTQSHLTSA